MCLNNLIAPEQNIIDQIREKICSYFLNTILPTETLKFFISVDIKTTFF